MLAMITFITSFHNLLSTLHKSDPWRYCHRTTNEYMYVSRVTVATWLYIYKRDCNSNSESKIGTPSFDVLYNRLLVIRRTPKRCNCRNRNSLSVHSLATGNVSELSDVSSNPPSDRVFLDLPDKSSSHYRALFRATELKQQQFLRRTAYLQWK